MSNSDKAAEPTMDEILASIRKIISEEPDGAGAAPTDDKTIQGASAQPSTAGAVWTSGGASADDDLSDILGQPTESKPGEAVPPVPAEPPQTRGPARPAPPASRPSFGQRPAPPHLEAGQAPPPDVPPAPPVAAAQGKSGAVTDSPFGLPLPVQPMSGDGPLPATPPLPTPPSADRGPAPSLRRPTPPAPSSAAAPPPADVPLAKSAPPPAAAAVTPLPKAEVEAPARKAVPPAKAENPEIGFTLADRLRAFGIDGASDETTAEQVEKPSAVPDETPKAAPAKPEPPVRKAEKEEPVPFAMRAAREETTDRDEATSDDAPGIGIKFGDLLNEADDDVSAPTPAMKAADDKPKVDPGPASQPPAPESVIAVPAAAEEKEVKAPPPPEPVDLAAREPAIRRGVFGLPELADEEPAKDDASAPPPGEQPPKADGPPPFVGFDETFGARALEMLAEPPPTAEPPPVDEPEQTAEATPAIGLPQQASPEPGQTPATETAAKSDPDANPVDDAGPAIPLVAASAAVDDVEAVQDTGPGSIEGSTPPPQADEGAASAPAETGQGPAGRSLEDTVSALLRPMLRDWLDTNMPGIVEKALKEELAPHDADPSKSDGPKDAKD